MAAVAAVVAAAHAGMTVVVNTAFPTIGMLGIVVRRREGSKDRRARVKGAYCCALLGGVALVV